MVEIEVSTDIVLRAYAGCTLRDYFESALAVVKSQEIKECLLSFNGWYYMIGTKFVAESIVDLEDEYEAYIQSKQ